MTPAGILLVFVFDPAASVVNTNRGFTMRITARYHHGILIIEPRERLTAETEREFTATVRAVLDAGSPCLVLDLASVPYLDSLGLGAIVQAYTSARRSGGNLKLVHVSGRNRQLLTVTRLLTVLEAYDTEDDAVQSFDAPLEVVAEHYTRQRVEPVRS
jgi:anti-sigma B factor antagonist